MQRTLMNTSLAILFLLTSLVLSSCATRIGLGTGSYKVIVLEMPELRATIQDDGSTVIIGHDDFVDIMKWAFTNDLQVRADCIANGQTIDECKEN